MLIFAVYHVLEQLHSLKILMMNLLSYISPLPLMSKWYVVVFVIYCHVTPEIQWLKTANIYCLTISVGQELGVT